MAGSSSAAMRLLWLLLPCVLANRQHILLSQGARSATNMSAPITAAIAEGKTVTFTVASWKVGNKVQFLNGATVVFELQVIDRNGVKMLARQVANSLPDTWGGWPLGATGFTVTLTSTSWQFEAIIGGTPRRMPWYDYYFSSIPTVTAYQVTPPEAMTGVVANKVCRIACNPSECSQCPGQQSDCKSHTANGCKGGSEGRICCEGIVSSTGALTINSASEGDTVRIVNQIPGDATYLDRSCASIGAHATCVELKKLQASSTVQKLVVMEKEVSNDGPTGVLVVYVPSLATTLHFSPWALISETTVIQTFSFTAGKPGLTLDAANGQVLWRTDQALQKNVPIGWFVQRINTNKQFTMNRLHQLAKGTAAYTITFSDVPELKVDSKCISDYTWTDDLQNGCSKYESSNWCTKVGKETDSWRRERCSGSSCPFTADSSGITASDQCCACGGGTFDPNAGGPAPTPPGPPPPFDCTDCAGGEEGVERVGVQMVLKATNADYAKLTADSALTENLRKRVEQSGLDRVKKAGGARVDFQAGSIHMILTLWHDDGKGDEILAETTSVKNSIRQEVEGALKSAEFANVVTGTVGVTVYTDPVKVTIRSGLGKDESLFDQLNAIFSGYLVVVLAAVGGCCLCCCFGFCFVMRGSAASPPRFDSPSTRGAEIPERRETVKSEKYDDALHGSSFAGTTYAADDYSQSAAPAWDGAGTSHTYGEDPRYASGAQDDWDQHGDGRDDRDYDRDERSDRKKDRNRKKDRRGDDDDQGALPRDRSDVSLASNVSGVSDAGQGGKLEPKSQRGARHRPSPRRR